MRNLEQELKLLLNEREYRILRESGGGEEKLQINYYFSSKSMPSDEMVRVRVSSGRNVLCYKKRLSDGGGVLVADERETEIDDDTAQRFILSGISKVELLEKLSVHMSEDLRLKGSLKTFRSKFTLDEWKLELDRNEYLGYTDYELECESSEIESLEKLKSYLTYAFGITVKPSRPKVQRFAEKLAKRGGSSV